MSTEKGTAPRRKPTKKEQLEKLRGFTRARKTQKPGQVIGLPEGMTARWLDLGDGPGRTAELRALFDDMGFDKDPSLSVVGVAQAEVWTAPIEAEEILLEARIEKNRAKAERRARTRNTAAHEALLDELEARMSRVKN